MRRMHILTGIAVVAVTVAGILALPAVGDRRAGTAPTPRRDIGTGERLIVLVAGEYSTREAAVTAEAAMGFHEITGFLVARSDDFDSMPAGRFVLVSAFRTVAGANEFQQVARAIGVRGIRRIVTVYRGRSWIGLGQEAHPDGSGPLIGPVRPMR